jgi:GNAT superfamily N-acetyltransferase
MSGWRIEVATAEDALDALYAFRYRVYVEEMACRQRYADHAARRIRDPLDSTGYNIVAWDSTESVAGCVRVNFARDGALDCYGASDYYCELLNMNAVGSDHPAKTSVCTRLMVAPTYRRSALATRLSRASFDLGLDHGIAWNFINCDDRLVEFFARLGYERTHMGIHEEHGRVNVMRLNVLDYCHLKAIGSVFHKNLERYRRQRKPALSG